MSDELAAAVEEGLFASLAAAARLPGAQLREAATASSIDSGTRFAALNGVYRLRLPDGGEGEAILDELVARFRDRPCAFWLGPSTRPLDTSMRLYARGLELHEQLAGVARDLATPLAPFPSPSGLMVARVGTREELDAWAAIVVEGYGLADGDRDELARVYEPLGLGATAPYRLYLATRDGAPVAAAQAHWSPAVATLSALATRIEARGAGAGTAVVHAMTRDAAEGGMRFAVAHALAGGLAITRALGFHLVCHVSQWVP